MKEKEHVKLSTGCRERVMNMVQLKATNLTRALRFENNSLKARKARLYAVNLLHQRVYICKKRMVAFKIQN